MIDKIRAKFLPLLAGLVLVTAMLYAEPAMAQFFDETLEQDELFVEDEDQFFEPRGDELGAPLQEQDFTEGDRFVDESQIPRDQRGVTARERQFQLTLEGERNELPLNIAWGAGTGLLIGGWFALVAEGDNRETQRSIGMGIVVGIIMGALVGTRSVLNPEGPRAAENRPPPADEPSQITPLVTLLPKQSRIGFQLTF